MAEKYHDLLDRAIQGLPEEAMTEILDFIYFMRRKFLSPQDFQEEIKMLLVKEEIQSLHQNETSHLEEEFEDYHDRYPKE